MSRQLLISDGFAPEAAALRQCFDERFADPRAARPERFVWDYWNVPGQYTHLRTPAYHYFPQRLYERFHQRLVLFGRRVLGCHDVSPPWLSCYIDGCVQELHGDLPHGHWAFVFSLTRWQGRSFRGGETLLLRPAVLDWWRGFQSLRGVEEAEVVQAVPPRFNRLVVFDPRVPHGVRRVSGTHDPREGRVVIHGWFVQPRPFIEGALGASEVERGLSPLHEVMKSALGGGLPVAGLVSLRLRVRSSGQVSGAQVLCDTTRVPAELEPERRRLVTLARRTAAGLHFARKRGSSTVTLPLVFSR